MMYGRDFTFTGKHALMVKNLKESPFKRKSNDSSQEKFVFRTYIDLFMVAPLIGVIYNRKSYKDNSPNSANIAADAFSTRVSDIDFLIQLVILTHQTELLSDQEKIEMAFKGFYDEGKADIIKSLFESYLLGGIEILYETCVDKTKNVDEVISNFKTFNSNFISMYSPND